MSSTIVVPQGFSYVLASLVANAVLVQTQAGMINDYRRAAKISYPQNYAEKAEMEASKEAYIFNCAQRAHHNTLEHMPFVMICTLVFGLRYPIYAAVTCGVYTASRVMYNVGYLSGGPQKRHSKGGWIQMPASAVMLAGALWTVGSMVYEGI